MGSAPKPTKIRLIRRVRALRRRQRLRAAHASRSGALRRKEYIESSGCDGSWLSAGDNLSEQEHGGTACEPTSCDRRRLQTALASCTYTWSQDLPPQASRFLQTLLSSEGQSGLPLRRRSTLQIGHILGFKICLGSMGRAQQPPGRHRPCRRKRTPRRPLTSVCGGH